MSLEHPNGKALNIVRFVNDDLEFNQVELQELLLHPDVKERKVVALTIVGAFRKGKSFFMDYCLRFMYANYQSVSSPSITRQNNDSWIGEQDEPLNGFTWRSGVRRDTTGIIFWSDVFLYDAPNGDKIAIIFVDTQGLFDNETTVEVNSKIFALSTLISSCQLLNLTGVIQEDQLQYLQFATEFATFSSSPRTAKPFQKFMFLIRDWANPDEFEFGVEGGKKYLDSILQIKPTQTPELKSVRQHINDSFENLGCCLLSYPGKAVARDSTYDGRWSQMDEDFFKELKAFIPLLLKPENLVIKKINNIEVTSALLCDYLHQYLTIFQSTKNPQVKSIYEATIETFLAKLVDESFNAYITEFVQWKSPENETEIETVLSTARINSLHGFNIAKKMGTEKHLTTFRDKLKKKIEDHAIEYRGISMANILRTRVEQQRRLEAEKEAERLKLQREEEERKARERTAQLEKETREREAEADRKREELRQHEIAIQKELDRQRVAEEQRQKEIAEQRRIEAERRAEEERRREEERRKILFSIHEGPIHVDVPKPKCVVM